MTASHLTEQDKRRSPIRRGGNVMYMISHVTNVMYMISHVYIYNNVHDILRV